MKKITINTAIVLAATLVSCEDDFLNYGEYVLNTNEYVSETIGGVTNFANNVYNYLDYEFGQNYSGAMLASATDEAVYSLANNSIQGFVNGGWSVANSLDSRWSNDYKGIQCANFYLDNYQGMTFDDYKYNGTYDADMFHYYNSFLEVRALRAYYYLDLVRNYGDVPYFTKTMTVEEVNSLKRTNALVVLDSVMAECDAIVDTILADYTNPPVADIGYGKELLRADKAFVLATKARAAMLAASPMYNPSNDKAPLKRAIEATKELIDWCESKGKTIQSTSYDKIASAFALEAKEVIFSRLVYGKIQTSTHEQYNYPVGINGAGAGGNCPSQTLVDAYEMKATGLGISDNASGYDPENPYVGRDPRFELTVAYNGSVWPTCYVDTIDGVLVNTLETFEGGASGLPKTGATPTGYYLRKGLDGMIDFRSGSTGLSSSYHSWILFRLGEFYLNYAEAVFMYSGDPNNAEFGMSANDAVNVIRKRAGMPVFPSDLAGDDWMRKYKNERFVELAFEGHRFYDLRRWKGASDGIDAEHCMKEVSVMSITKNADGSFKYTKKVQNRVWDNKMYLFPITQSEVVKNPNLGQNPGW